MIESSASTSAVNVTRLIDDGPLTRFQIVTIICCALVSALDGIDTQSIGVAAPFIAEELASSSPILDRFFHRRWSGRPSVPRPSARWRIASAARHC